MNDAGDPRPLSAIDLVAQVLAKHAGIEDPAEVEPAAKEFVEDLANLGAIVSTGWKPIQYAPTDPPTVVRAYFPRQGAIEATECDWMWHPTTGWKWGQRSAKFFKKKT